MAVDFMVVILMVFTLFLRGALIVIHQCLWNTVILAGIAGRPVRARSESRHMDVKIRKHPVLLNNGRGSKVTIHGAGFGNCSCIALPPAIPAVDRHPCRYDDSWAELRIACEKYRWKLI
ncbi:MAG: hypothetical protein NTX38_19255 [Methylobacter sp.]|nr:hypothetical protein [Methylobacter sp.]